MADLVWGEPVVGGETLPPDSPRGAWLYRIGDDGTQTQCSLPVLSSVRFNRDSSSSQLAQLFWKPLLGAFLTRYCSYHGPFLRGPSIPGPERQRPRLKAAMSASPTRAGAVPFGPVGTTPGTPYYRMRRILGEHALRYISEHNPSQLRFADPTQKRIETIAHELTDVDRVKAANADQFIRGEIGHLWGFIHFFVVTPPKRSDLWHPIRDEIDELLIALLCRVRGLRAYPTGPRASTPMRTGRSGRRAGMRFTVDRQFNAEPYTKNGIVTAATHEGDLQDFVNALDWASEGYPDDDYLAPRTVVADSPSNPIMPDFGDNMIRSYLSSGWRLNYDAHMRAPLAGLETGIYRKWCTLNLLAMLDDRNFHGFSWLPDHHGRGSELRGHSGMGPQLQPAILR